MSTLRFSPVQDKHLPALAHILNYYIQHTAYTFHDRVQGPEDMREKVYFDKPMYRSFIIQNQDSEEILGYCALAPWKKPEAYRYTAEVYLYLAPDFTGKGLGAEVLNHLESYAAAQGVLNLIAAIIAENTPSIRLFSRNGYQQQAYFVGTGYKFGRFLDVVYMQKQLKLETAIE